MKTKLFILWMGIALAGCDNMNQTPDTGKNYPVAIAIEDFMLQSACNPTNLQADTIYIFNSPEDVMATIDCLSNIEDIDWEKNSLLAVKMQQRYNAGSKVIQKSLQEVADGQYQLQIEIQPSMTAIAAPLVIYMQAPKFQKKEMITLIVSSGDETGTFSLKNTQWKLAGLVDAQTGKLTALAPEDCETCYTLSFQSDSLGSAKSVENIITVDLNTPPFFLERTDIDETGTGDAALFYEAISTIVSYRIESKKLKFFYDNERKYLLYEEWGGNIAGAESERLELEGNAYLFKNTVPDEIMVKLQEERNASGFVAWIVYKPDIYSALLYVLSQEEINTLKNEFKQLNNK